MFQGPRVTYRMVIGQPVPDGLESPMAFFWFEEARTSCPWWMPFASWWIRWRRISPRQKIVLRDRTLRAGLIVPFESETEMYAMQLKLDESEAANPYVNG